MRYLSRLTLPKRRDGTSTRGFFIKQLDTIQTWLVYAPHGLMARSDRLSPGSVTFMIRKGDLRGITQMPIHPAVINTARIITMLPDIARPPRLANAQIKEEITYT